MGVFRGVAQLVERRSPKPKVAGSIPAAPANKKRGKNENIAGTICASSQTGNC